MDTNKSKYQVLYKDIHVFHLMQTSGDETQYHLKIQNVTENDQTECHEVR